jgi:quercetin dioxygenase-like cupin family protein/uncharacterized protein YndB with AHSA1/START domain
MANAGDVLDIGALGMRIEFRRTAADTGGESLAYDVIGRPRGFPAVRHVHPAQSERHDVIAGALRVAMAGQERVLGPGDAVLIPPGTPHRHVAGGAGEGRVRVEVRPALRTEQLLERLAELSRGGRIGARGMLGAVDAARLVRDFPREGHGAVPPAPLQRAAARAILAVADVRARARRAYEFVDEWDVAAPAEAVYAALADGRTYPDWWRPVYIGVEADGPARVGQLSKQHFKGPLPYHLHTRSTVVHLDPPHVIVADVDGDLRGRGTWTLTAVGPERTHVRFDWVVHADRPLLRALTPVLRPVFRWNHSWAIARAIDGLEPYARGQRVTARR